MTGRNGRLSALRGRVDENVVSALARSAALGFLGDLPVSEQVDHALGFVAVVEDQLGGVPPRVADLGSGGGLPSLVLHSCWPECSIVLLEASRRRAEFLESVVAELRDGRPVSVVRGRIEELARMGLWRERFAVVTSRSFGPPAVTAECGAPLVEVGGLMIVSDPPGPEDPARWPAAGLAQLGLVAEARRRLDNRFNYRVLVKQSAVPDRYPRRVGIPSKRPLF